MRIQNNIAAMNAKRNLRKNQGSLKKTLEKLSSGYRINRSADDTAGLAISERMRASISSLDQVENNVQDAIALIQTADGAMQEIQDMLCRMTTLAVQAANGTITEKERDAIQEEIDQILHEVNRIKSSTDFNDIPLLNGTSILNSQDNLGSLSFGEIPLLPGQNNGGVNNLGVDSAYLHFGIAQIDFSNPIPLGELDVEIYAEYKDYTLTITVSQGTLTEAEKNGQTVDEESVSREVFSYTAPANSADALAGTQITLTSAEGHRAIVTLGTGSVQITNQMFQNIQIVGSGETKSKRMISATEGRRKEDISTENDDLILQIGDTKEDTMGIDLPDMRLNKIGIEGLSVRTIPDAQNAITKLANGVDYVSTERGRMGAYQNRLEHTYRHTGNTVENLTQAESTLRDADIADEMAKYTKENILIQSAQAMLAQSNQTPQGVLSLMQ